LASHIITSSFGQFLFYRPVRTVTGLITRSIFILPSCRNRHRTHQDEEEYHYSYDYYTHKSCINQHIFYKVHTWTLWAVGISSFHSATTTYNIQICEIHVKFLLFFLVYL